MKRKKKRGVGVALGGVPPERRMGCQKLVIEEQQTDPFWTSGRKVRKLVNRTGGK